MIAPKRLIQTRLFFGPNESCKSQVPELVQKGLCVSCPGAATAHMRLCAVSSSSIDEPIKLSRVGDLEAGWSIGKLFMD